MCSGNFTLYEGRSSYNLNQVTVTHHFVELAARQPGVYYGYYFLELADYFGREGTDEKNMMNLLYLTVKALLNPEIDDRLVRCIFELRTYDGAGADAGAFPVCELVGRRSPEKKNLFFSQVGTWDPGWGLPEESKPRRSQNRPPDFPAALYTMQYIVSSPMTKLYSFTVTDEVLWELERHIQPYVAGNTDKKFKSLQILEVMM